MTKYPSRIATKVVIAVAVALLFATVAFVYFAQRTGSRLFEQQVQAKALGISEFGSALLEHAMLEGQQGHVQDILRAGVTSHEAAALFILRTDGTVAFSSDITKKEDSLPLEEFKSTPTTRQALFFTRQEDDTLYAFIINPIVKKPACYRCHTNNEELRGFFGVKVSMADLSAMAASHRTTNMLLTAISFFGIGVVVFITLFLFVTRPLSHLRSRIASAASQIQLLEERKQLHLIPVQQPHANDEVGDIISAFNHLIQKLDGAYENLRLLHETELQQADRLTAAGEMAAGIVHEIRNPMAGVLGALQVLHAETPEDNPRKDILKEMMSQMQRMNDSLNDLLSYAKPASSVFSEVDVNEIIEKTLTLAISKTDPNVVRIEKQYDRTLPRFWGDQKLLQQLFWNIILNGVDAMSTAGTLTIKTWWLNGMTKNHLGGTVHITIRDTGKGISPSELGKIFKPFHTTKHKGTGLGLAISKQIVGQHHGSITVESQLGHGTTVDIALPIQPLKGD